MAQLFKTSSELQQYLQKHPTLTPAGISLGTLLLDCGAITQSQLEQALAHQHAHPELGRLGQVLLNLKMLSAERLGLTLAQQLGIAQVSLESFDIQPECVKLVPENLARRYLVVPLMLDGERLIVASPDPTHCELLHLLGFVTGKPVEAVLANASEVEQTISRLYASATAHQLPENETNEQSLSLHRIKQLAEDPPTVRFDDSLLEEAISRRASDIHLRPGEHDVVLLLRIDGV
ncbi:MAG: hypothetical protein CFE49_13945 [Pseudomonas sp. PGPPP3]|nr:MAG: hypothetical protein CFE49_13945 [Pseudomonas sp. PGPPP3]